jgi:putative peptidoglycan lipid II flippase
MLLFNKSILNLEKYFVSYYLVDIFIYSINILVLLLFLEDDIVPLAYSMIIATTIALLWQFYLIFHKISLSYFFQREHHTIKSVYKNSIKEKFSGLLYGLKEPLLAMIFLSLGEGVYSLFNYAHKFAAAIYQVTSAPIINRFVTKIHHLVAQKSYISINAQIKTTLFETVPLFSISSIVFYLLIPFTMPLFFTDILTPEQLNTMQIFYLYMSTFYLVISFEAPFSTTFSAFKLFNYKLLLNGLFFLFMCGMYLLYKLNSFDYSIYLFILIFAQTMNLLLYVNKSKKYLKGKL